MGDDKDKKEGGSVQLAEDKGDGESKDKKKKKKNKNKKKKKVVE